MRIRASTTVTGCVLSVTAVACGVLIGIDDRSLDDQSAVDVPNRSDGAPQDTGSDTGAIDTGADVAPVCPTVCSNCDGGVCEIDCPSTACKFPVKCPAGMPCRVRCIGQKACDAKGNIDCSAATACTIVCRGGADACDNFTITAGGTPICLKCDADGTCGSDLKCSTTSQCKKQCSSGSSCASGCGTCTPTSCP